VRITGQLIEAETGNDLWAERFDRDMADIVAIQDEITQSVVGSIEPEMLLIEGKRAFRKSVKNLDAFNCCMRAMWHFSQKDPREPRPSLCCGWPSGLIRLSPRHTWRLHAF